MDFPTFDGPHKWDNISTSCDASKNVNGKDSLDQNSMILLLTCLKGNDPRSVGM